MPLTFKKIKKLGEGTYAVVHLAEIDRSGFNKILEAKKSVKKSPTDLSEDQGGIKSSDNEKMLIAVKRIKSVGLDLPTIRELKTLKRCASSQNIVKLLAVCTYFDSCTLLLEYCPYSLDMLIKNKNILLLNKHIKTIIHQIMKGLYFLHRRFILHRDIKPGNILISTNGIVKLCDFGLSRDLNLIDMEKHPDIAAECVTDFLSPEKRQKINKKTIKEETFSEFYENVQGGTVLLSSNVVTRWYRPPELFINPKDVLVHSEDECEGNTSILYTSTIDIWSVGCLHFELLTRCVLFGEESDLAMCESIGRVVGWDYKSILHSKGEKDRKEKRPPNFTVLRDLLKSADPLSVSFIERMLHPDPTKRIGAYNALKNEYFIGVEGNIIELVKEMEKNEKVQ